MEKKEERIGGEGTKKKLFLRIGEKIFYLDFTNGRIPSFIGSFSQMNFFFSMRKKIFLQRKMIKLKKKTHQNVLQSLYNYSIKRLLQIKVSLTATK